MASHTYTREAKAKAQGAYMAKASRVQLVFNPDNKKDAELVEFLRSIDDGRPAATQVKEILHKYIAASNVFKI